MEALLFIFGLMAGAGLTAWLICRVRSLFPRRNPPGGGKP